VERCGQWGGTSLQPSSYQWMGRVQVGTDGNNRAIYPAIREFELSWTDFTRDLAQLINVQLACVTGQWYLTFQNGETQFINFIPIQGLPVREPQVGLIL